MPAGIEIQTSTGKIQISSDFPTPSLASQGTITITTNVAYDVYKHTINFVSEFPFIGLRPVTFDHAITARVVNSSGNNHSVEIYSNQYGIDVDYFVFDRAPSSPLSHGLEIFDDAGNLTFTSNYPPFLVKSMHITDHSSQISTDSSDVFVFGNPGVLVLTRSQQPPQFLNWMGLTGILRNSSGYFFSDVFVQYLGPNDHTVNQYSAGRVAKINGAIL